MTQVLRLAWVVTMTLAALVVAASVLGGASPRGRLTGVFDVDCLMPCWQGIRPGVTDADTAISLLSISPFVDTRYLSIVGESNQEWWQIAWANYSRRNTYLWGALTLVGDVVVRIDVNFSHDWPVTVEDLIGQLGMPPAVFGREDGPVGGRRAVTLLLAYPEVGLEVAVSNVAWRPLGDSMHIDRLTYVAVNPDGPRGPWWEVMGMPPYGYAHEALVR